MGSWKTLKTDSGTGWKEIYRDAGTGWKALSWDSVPIDVGDPCINRNSNWWATYTVISKGNPANASGTLTNVCLYMKTAENGDGRVGTFYQISGNTYKCRDAEAVGTLSVGENNKTVSLTIETGDLIGLYFPNGELESATSGGSGALYDSGNYCTIDTQNTYTPIANYIQSIYGTG